MSVAAELTAPPTAVPTPCIGVCQIDEATGLCKGCARTSEEVAAWQKAGADYKLRVWEELPPRRAGLSLGAYRLPWAPIDIICMIERSLRRRWGRWALGFDGASVSFGIGADEDADIVSRDGAVTAVTARGALHLHSHQKVIAVAFGDVADGNGPEAIGLVLPRGRADLRKGQCFTSAGVDGAAICAAHRDAQLFDLGIGAKLAARLCLRTDDMSLAETLNRTEGRDWRDAIELANAGMPAAHAHTIVETGLGRVEVFAPPMAHADLNTFAELKANSLDAPSELPSGWELPWVFAPCALFFPHNRKPAQSMLDGHY